MPANRKIEVKCLSRVEGEGALFIRLDGDRVEHVELNIFEPPRFFEALLRGREIREVPDIVARICGICPVAYQMGACHALAKALGVTVPLEIRRLRRLLYCAEWIQRGVIAPVPRIMRLFWAFSPSNSPESPSQEESSPASMIDTLEARCRSGGPPAGPRSIDLLPVSKSFRTASSVA